MWNAMNMDSFVYCIVLFRSITKMLIWNINNDYICVKKLKAIFKNKNIFLYLQVSHLESWKWMSQALMTASNGQTKSLLVSMKYI